MAGQKETKTPSSKKPNNASAMGIDIEDRKSSSLGSRGKSFVFWFIGLIISFAPLVSVHLRELIVEEKDFLLELFSDVEIFFICVSMLVSASCEIISQQKNRDILNGVLLICIVFFALFYVEFSKVELIGDAKYWLAFVTKISLGITLFMGIISYFSKRRCTR